MSKQANITVERLEVDIRGYLFLLGKAQELIKKASKQRDELGASADIWLMQYEDWVKESEVDAALKEAQLAASQQENETMIKAICPSEGPLKSQAAILRAWAEQNTQKLGYKGSALSLYLDKLANTLEEQEAQDEQ